MSALSRVSSLGQEGGCSGSQGSGNTRNYDFETLLMGQLVNPRCVSPWLSSGWDPRAGLDRAHSPVSVQYSQEPGDHTAISRTAQLTDSPTPQHTAGARLDPRGCPHLLSCLWRASSLLSTSPRDRRPGLERGMLRRLGAGAGHRGSSWYWRPRLSPQKLKMLDTPEKAPGARELGEGDQDRRHAPPPSPLSPRPT